MFRGLNNLTEEWKNNHFQAYKMNQFTPDMSVEIKNNILKDNTNIFFPENIHNHSALVLDNWNILQELESINEMEIEYRLVLALKKDKQVASKIFNDYNPGRVSLHFREILDFLDSQNDVIGVVLAHNHPDLVDATPTEDDLRAFVWDKIFLRTMGYWLCDEYIVSTFDIYSRLQDENAGAEKIVSRTAYSGEELKNIESSLGNKFKNLAIISNL